MIYIVLGMHKSGTTLVARILHESGIPMGQDFTAGSDYAKAKYEARWVQRINDEILGTGRNTLSSTVTSRLLPRGDPPDAVFEAMRAGITDNDARHANWGFKDPRSVLTYDYWRRVLPPHRLIIVYRNPIEVWKHYFRKDRFWRLRQPFHAWTDYNTRILRYVDEKMPEHLLLMMNFGSLLSGDADLARLETFVGTPLTDVRNPDQARNRLAAGRGQPTPLRAINALFGRRAAAVYRRLDARARHQAG